MRNPNMRTINTLAALGWAAWIALAAPLAWAGDGHDHGEAPCFIRWSRLAAICSNVRNL